MREFCWLCSLVLALLLGAPVRAAAADDGALAALSRAHAELDTLARAEAKAEAKAEARKKIRTRVDALIDYRAFAVAVLGGKSVYRERCGDRCAEFESLLRELIRHHYLSRLEARASGSVEIVREHVRATASKVDTRVRYVDDEGRRKTVSVNYVMHRRGGRWQIRNIYTEGVSLVENQRYEVDELYARGGIDQVVETLRRKVSTLAKNDKKR